MIYDSYDIEVIDDRMEMEAEVIREMNQMKEFEFTYYGFIPGYNDFDIDSETIRASSKEAAEKIFWATRRFIKNGPSIKEL